MFIVFSTISKGQVQDEKRHILLGDNYFKLAEFDEAVQQYTFALEYNPDNVETLLKRAKVFAVLERSNDSSRDLQKANSLNPYAGVFLSSDMRENIISKKKFEFDNIDNDSNDETSGFNKSYIINAEYEKYIGQNSDGLVIDTLMEYALLSIINEDYDEAKYYLNILESENYESPLFYDLEGLLYLRNADYEEAIESFEKAIVINPNFVLAHHNLGIVYQKLGQLDKAAESFDTAIKLNSSIANIYFGRAKIMERMNNEDQAIEEYKKALNISDSYYQARVNYSVLLKTSGQYELALNEINKSIRSNPEIVENYFIRAGLYFIYGEYENAIEDYESYLQEYPNDGETYYNMGVSKILNQDTFDGCKDLETSLNLGFESNNNELMLFYCD
jgi:tetratricopeptide (TPR) repeat protein